MELELSPIALFTIILISTLIAMAVLKVLHLPTLPAYFIAGLFVGPNGLGIMHSSEEAYFAGEMGIVLLLFSIGLKFNLSTLYSIRHYVIYLGNMQVLTTAVALTIPAWLLFDDLFIASLIGFVGAMSSTAIVSQILMENNAVTSPLGRRTIAVLLLQDLAIIPLIIIYSDQSGDQSLLVTTVLLVLKIAAVLMVVILVAPKLMILWLNWVSRHGDKELFIFNIVAIIALFSLMAGAAGLSYVLGSFLAGILISETFHRHRTEQIIEPFRQILLGFFFITLGVLIDPAQLAENWVSILLLSLGLLAIKFPIVYGCVRLAKTHKVTSFRTAFLLGGTGEFGFVLLAIAKESGVLPDDLFQIFVPVNMLTMLVVPLLWGSLEKNIHKIFPDDKKVDEKKAEETAELAKGMEQHIIICGFGRTGQAIAGILRTMGDHNFIALEDDPVILSSVGTSEKVTYGKSDRGDILASAGIKSARAIVVTYTEQVASETSVKTARELNADIYIIAKATTAQQAQELEAAGANEVLVEAHETGFVMAERSLRRANHGSLWALPHAMETARKRTNPLFTGQFSGTEQNADSKRMVGVQVTSESGDITLDSLPEGVEVVAWRRYNREMSLDDKTEKLQPNDQVVLLGGEEALRNTEILLSA